MQKKFFVIALLVASLPGTDAAAFVDDFEDGENVERLHTLAPPPHVTLRGTRLWSNDATGAVTFLGAHTLGLGKSLASLDDDGLQEAVHAYVQDVVGMRISLRPTTVDRDGDQLRLAFIQTVKGIDIAGTFVIARVTSGTLRYARQLVVAPPQIDVRPQVNAAAAATLAAQDAQSFSSTARPNDAVLQVLYVGDVPKLAWRVSVATEAPFGQWNIFIDALTGARLVRQKVSLDAVEGSVHASVEDTCAGGAQHDQALPFVEWSPHAYTDAQGSFSSASSPSSASVRLVSPYVYINNFNATDALWTSALAPSPAHNDIELEAGDLAQVDPFYHVHRVRAWFRDGLSATGGAGLAKARAWTDGQLWVNVNIPRGTYGYSCNAFYNTNDSTLNFYAASNGCNNTSRAAKVLYHEYGHGVHAHLSAVFDGQLSEGMGDFVSAMVSGEPTMTGLLDCATTLSGAYSLPRTCENTYTYCTGNACDASPNDRDPHNAAPVMCGALWDLRKNLTARYGAADGDGKMVSLFVRFLTLVDDVSSAYGAMIAADEDTDNNPRNGTTHSCEINAAFATHFPAMRRHLVPCLH